MFLVGDLGGTKVDIALCEQKGNAFVLQHKQRYFTREYQSLDDVIKAYLSTSKLTPKFLCFGIAGAVKEGKSKITNLPWQIDEQLLQKVFGFSRACLINDLEAIAYGTMVLSNQDFAILNAAKAIPGHNQAVIAAGTGLGEAGLFWDGKGHRPFATEGGHTDYTPKNQLEIELWKFLSERCGHVSQERVVSGSAIPVLYEFLSKRSGRKQPQEIEMQFKEKDPAVVITDLALDQKDEICVQAINLFIENYGSEAGNLALKHLARSGIFIGGGIAPKILPLLQKGGFMKAFKQKGRFEHMLEEIPVKVIINRDVNLLGAAKHVSSHLIL